MQREEGEESDLFGGRENGDRVLPYGLLYFGGEVDEGTNGFFGFDVLVELAGIGGHLFAMDFLTLTFSASVEERGVGAQQGAQM